MFWSVVQTETNREHIARLFMMRAGYETYAPRIKLRRRPAMLFSGYLFVRIVDRWYPLKWMPGVIDLLMNGEQPARLQDNVVENLKRREHKGFIRLPPKTPKIGSKRRIIGGLFAGHIALHDGMTAPEREAVLLDLLGQKVRVELAASDVAPLDVA